MKDQRGFFRCRFSTIGILSYVSSSLVDGLRGVADLKGNSSPDSGPWRKRWMREFYVRRSALHSGESAPSTWTDLFHGVIAAELFSLAVKRHLEQTGDRPLSDADRVSMDALDRRIEVLAILSSEQGDAWHEARAAAARRAMTTAVAEALRKGDV